MMAADLLRALTALGVTFVVDGEWFRASAPAGVVDAPLRARIGEHRDELRALLALPDWRGCCTPCDALLIEEDAGRFTREALVAFIGKWLAQYVVTGYGPFLEIAAWYAAVWEEQGQRQDKEDRPAA